jgi:hypothetical protein
MSYQTIALWARIVLETAIKCLSAQVVATQMQIINQFVRHAQLEIIVLLLLVWYRLQLHS